MNSFIDFTTEEWCSLAKITSLSQFHPPKDRDFATLRRSKFLQKLFYLHWQTETVCLVCYY